MLWMLEGSRGNASTTSFVCVESCVLRHRGHIGEDMFGTAQNLAHDPRVLTRLAPYCRLRKITASQCWSQRAIARVSTPKIAGSRSSKNQVRPFKAVIQPPATLQPSRKKPVSAASNKTLALALRAAHAARKARFCFFFSLYHPKPSDVSTARGDGPLVGGKRTRMCAARVQHRDVLNPSPTDKGRHPEPSDNVTKTHPTPPHGFPTARWGPQSRFPPPGRNPTPTPNRNAKKQARQGQNQKKERSLSTAPPTTQSLEADQAFFT